MSTPRQIQPTINKKWPRRKFIATSFTALSMSSLALLPGWSFAGNHTTSVSYTVQQIIDLILKEVPGAPIAQTVDTIKSGSTDQKVTSIVTTMFATIDVIKQTAASGANFIIAHEPTFYNHQDDTAWLKQDEVYQYKMDLLNKHQIAVWRFHDAWHMHKPDGILTGVLQALGWEGYVQKEEPNLLVIPSITLKDLAVYTKRKLGIQQVRVIGNTSQNCTRVALLPGAAGGKRQIEFIQKTKPDVLICGEVSEWETAEYVRDANLMGQQRSLIVLGHAVSEEAGMQYLVQWLQPKLPGLPIQHIPSKNPFSWV
jgi:putative NIF3 family GTP cyclohydrolase 1 type 2